MSECRWNGRRDLFNDLLQRLSLLLNSERRERSVSKTSALACDSASDYAACFLNSGGSLMRRAIAVLFPVCCAAVCFAQPGPPSIKDFIRVPAGVIALE